MKAIAATTEEMLEVVLFRLHMRGWKAVDVGKLVELYIDFSFRTRRCVYRTRSGPGLRDRLRASIDADIGALAAKGRLQRSVSRVRLTQDGLDQAQWLKLEQARHGSLLDCIEKVFPPLTPTA